jgi:isopenicillin N synthase-like dioxygenase
MARSIPVIDLQSSNHSELVKEIGDACSDFGFFGVVNHDIDPLIISEAFVQSRSFFSLDDTQKRALHIKNSPCNRGFDPIGWQSLDLSKEGDASAADLKESFYVGTEKQIDALNDIPNHGENQWPSQSCLPGFALAVNNYKEQATKLSCRLIRLVAQSLHMAPDALDSLMLYPTCTTRLLYYPPQRSAQGNQIGSGAHTDWGAVTVLAQDDLGGLEVRLINGDWIPVTPREGMLVINTGDLMQRWTNDTYLSAWHRVINKHEDKARYSIAHFFDMDHFAEIKTLPSCISASNPEKYPMIRAGDHILEMYRRTTLEQKK